MMSYWPLTRLGSIVMILIYIDFSHYLTFLDHTNYDLNFNWKTFQNTLDVFLFPLKAMIYNKTHQLLLLLQSRINNFNIQVVVRTNRDLVKICT